MNDDTGIVMYSTAWCGDCKRAKHFFNEFGIDYLDHDIDADPEVKQEMMRLNNGRASVPTIIFPDGSILVEPSNEQLATKLNVDLNRTFI